MASEGFAVQYDLDRLLFIILETSIPHMSSMLVFRGFNIGDELPPVNVEDGAGALLGGGTAGRIHGKFCHPSHPIQ